MPFIIKGLDKERVIAAAFRLSQSFERGTVVTRTKVAPCPDQPELWQTVVTPRFVHPEDYSREHRRRILALS
jgi:hypothetical protein